LAEIILAENVVKIVKNSALKNAALKNAL